MPKEIHKRLKTYRIEAGLSQKELADRLGVKPSAVSHWERGDHSFSVDAAIKICQILDISIQDLTGFYTDFSLNKEEQKVIKGFRKLDREGKDIVLDTIKGLNLYQEKYEDRINEAIAGSQVHYIERPLFDIPTSAGTGEFLNSSSYEMVSFPEEVVPPESTFALRVSGDSMEPTYPDGSYVFLKQADEILPGQIGVFNLNGDSYMKKLSNDYHWVSLNPKYGDIIISEYDEFRIIGKVVGSYDRKNGEK